MEEPEIKVEVTVPPGEETPPQDEPGETVVVVAPAEGGTDAGTILSLEMLRDQVTQLTEALSTSNARLDLALLELTGMQNRLIDLESEEAEEIVAEGGEIAVETIPPVVEETSSEEAAPEKRKRKFV